MHGRTLLINTLNHPLRIFVHLITQFMSLFSSHFLNVLLWIVVKTEVKFRPLHNKAQNPQQVNQNTVPLNNNHELVTFLLTQIWGSQQSVNAVNPHS